MTEVFSSAIYSSVRKIKAKAEFYENSALSAIYTGTDKIISFDIQRVGEDGKFFGFGICQRLNIHLIDMERALAVSTANSIVMGIGVQKNDGTIEYAGYPTFYVSETHRDENTNELSITAYDALYSATEHTVSELTLTKPYTIKEFCEACGDVLGVSVSGADGFTLEYADGANFEGTETLRDALDDVAEATQTIYFINSNNELCFKILDKSGAAVETLTKSKYITLKSGEGRRLQTICSANELGDNVSESTTQIGSTQYVRDNAFWELRDDIGTLVHNAITAIGDITIDIFDCSWRGNPALEIGDKIDIETRDNGTLTSFVLNDTLKYDGALTEQTLWKYDENSAETESNPTSIGDVIKQTYARVDKQNKEITLLASSVEGYDEKIAQLQLNQNSISATVSSVVQNQTDLTNNLANLQDNINQQNQSNAEQFETLTKKVDATMTSDEINLAISTEIAKGTDKVITSTGFKFDDEGLTISKSDSEMSTNIDEDGMSIFRNNEEVLTADNTGVNATNLHATTYLIIGTNSRFEDYGSDRTGCFWIGN
jgi:hypothetical protein